ncbi:MAG: ion transporter [Spirochaetia bacterium]
MYALRKLFRDVRFEFGLVAAIVASLVIALISIMWDRPWLEQLNLAFSLAFCVELSLRFLIAEDKRAYWKAFSLDWVASIPWDWLVLALVPQSGLALSWTRLLRLPRVLRVLRFVRLSRSNTLSRVGYFIKKQVEKSLPTQLGILVVVSVAIIFLFGVVFQILGSDAGFDDPFFFSLITMISSDSIFEVTEETGVFKGLTILLALLGVVLFNGVLIAILVTRIAAYLDNIREGRGRILEKGHLVILGWHELMPHLLENLEVYTQNERQSLTVVVQVPEISPQIRDVVYRFRRLDVVLRRGYPYQQADLRDLSLADGRTVLGLGSFNQADHENILIKSFLTLHSLFDPARDDRRAKTPPAVILNLPFSVVDHYLGDFRMDRQVTFDPFFYSATVLSSSIREPLLYDVFLELFSFEGSEIHFCAPGRAEGLRCGEIAGAYDQVQLLGMERLGTTQLLPPADQTVEQTDRLIVLAPSKRYAEAALSRSPTSPPSPPPPSPANGVGGDGHNGDGGDNGDGGTPEELGEPGEGDGRRAGDGGAGAAPEKPGTVAGNAQPATHDKRATAADLLRPYGSRPQFTAIIGVNSKTPFLIDELRKTGSDLLIIDDQPAADFRAWYERQTNSTIPNGVEFRQCGFENREEIATVLPLGHLERIVVLADESAAPGDPGRIDADTIYKILKIRALSGSLAGETIVDHAETVGTEAESAEAESTGGAPSLIAEILSPDSEEAVARIPGVRFVAGTQILGRLLSTYLLEPGVEAIHRQLVQRGGADLGVASIRIHAEHRTRFAQIAARGFLNGHAVLGVHRPRSGVTSINPGPDDKLYHLEPDDLAIVLSRQGSHAPDSSPGPVPPE